MDDCGEGPDEDEDGEDEIEARARDRYVSALVIEVLRRIRSKVEEGSVSFRRDDFLAALIEEPTVEEEARVADLLASQEPRPKPFVQRGSAGVRLSPQKGSPGVYAVLGVVDDRVIGLRAYLLDLLSDGFFHTKEECLEWLLTAVAYHAMLAEPDPDDETRDECICCGLEKPSVVDWGALDHDTVDLCWGACERWDEDPGAQIDRLVNELIEARMVLLEHDFVEVTIETPGKRT